METGSFHLSCKEYAILPLDWKTILGRRFSGYPIPIEFVDLDVLSELLGINYPLTRVMIWYFGPTDEPQIHMEWLRMNIP